MQNILVPTDFSSNAMKAFCYAGEIAQKSGAHILLLHVIEPTTDRIRQPHPLHEKLEKEIAGARNEELDIFQKSFAKIYPGVNVRVVTAKGAVIPSIVESAEDNKVDLVVMGTTGASGLKEIFFGSVTAGLIGKTKIPLLTVPAVYEVEEPDGILLATNHFEEDRSLLEPVMQIANLFNATVHVVVFVDTDTAEAVEYLENTRHLHKYMEFLKKEFPETSFAGEVLDGELFEETLDSYYTNHQLGIIGMIAYPKKGFERILRKSETKKIAYHSIIPLLAIPGK